MPPQAPKTPHETLHVYMHCPFCVKARMIFGLKRRAMTLRVLLNDDEAGPIRMVGAKQVPILETEGTYLAESMDIVARIDAIGTPVLTGDINPAIGTWLHDVSHAAGRLFLPRAAAAPLPEFATTSARAYFIRKKEESVGSFGAILADGHKEIAQINAALQHLAPLIKSAEAVNGTLSLDDIHLFAQLHTLSLIQDLDYPPPVEGYRKRMAERSGVELLDALAI